jgi:predicted restriction endonuclease
MSWRESTLEALTRMSIRHHSNFLTRAQIISEELETISQEVSTAGLTPAQTLSRTLQELRRDGYLEFDNHGGYILLSSALTPKAADISSEYLTPSRTTTTVHRIMRDSDIVAQLKRLYLYRSQICSTRLEFNSGYYCEAHHLKPLGVPHNGPDIKDNIIIVCPNHHVLLDYGALQLDIKSLELNKHAVTPAFLDYHNKEICRKP